MQVTREFRKHGTVLARGAAVAVAAWVAFGGTVLAGPLDLGDGVRGHYTLTLGYDLAVRTEGRASELTGPAALNSDDGDRNFHAGSIVHNRASALGELYVSKGFGDAGKYGIVVRGDAFYDQAYHGYNANNSPATVNKSGPHDRFVNSAKVLEGGDIRLLDAYVHGDWNLTHGFDLNVRVGRQVVAWGQSLFFSGMAAMQGPADATKTSVPGVEIKNILLPVNQVAVHLGWNGKLALLGYYRLQFKPSQLFPIGSYMSTVDFVGPGAEFLYGPGMARIPRGADIEPSDFGQWGAGLEYQVTPMTAVGSYFIRYSNANPEVQMGLSASGSPVYNLRYYDGIDMYAVTFSTSVGAANVAGEFSYRDGVDMLLSSNQATRGQLTQALVSAIYTMPSNFISREIDLVGEVGYIHVNSVDAMGGNRTLANSKNSWGFEGVATLHYFRVLPGWDVAIPLTFEMIAKGNPAMAGAFGGMAGEGDQRIGLAANFTYLNNLQVGVGYNIFLGTPNLKEHPFADRDFAGFSIKYSF